MVVRDPERADVAHVGFECGDHGGDVELRVVGEHAHRVSGTEAGADLGQVTVGPVDDDLVGLGEPGLGGEGGPGVAHGHVVTEHLGHPRQRGAEVDGPEDHEARWRDVGLVEDLVGVAVEPTLIAVSAHAGHSRDER